MPWLAARTAGIVLVIAVATFPARTVAAPLPGQAGAEIGYLLESIGASGCEFFRNGSWHDARAAKAHLASKYSSLLAAGRINSAEDFIERAATNSSFSGSAYAVRCGAGAAVSSSSWLHDQLARYRGRPGQSAPRELRGAPTVEPPG